MRLKTLLRRAIGDSNTGALEYFLSPRLRGSFGGPFNGQRNRQKMFEEIADRFHFKAIVETGTYRGTTTDMFARAGVPVYTVELHPRYFSYSRVRFWWEGQPNLHLYRNDSRAFLRGLCGDRSVPKQDVFFYLDAHWGDDLPLREELEIILACFRRSVVMIDDFEVPNLDYKFDDYGPGKVLNLKYIESLVSAHRLAVHFPVQNAVTDKDRGCVVLLHGIEAPAGGFSTLAPYPA